MMIRPTWFRMNYFSLLGRYVLVATAIAATSLVVLPTPTANAERKSILDGQPAIRSRLLLVRKRFEVAPAFEATINADYRHTLAAGLKLEYHFTDKLSVGAVGFYGGGLNTGLVDRIVDTLPDTPPANDRSPTSEQYQQHLNDIPLHGAAYVTYTPWHGKLAAFSRIFVHFDFYFSAGLAYAKLSNDCSDTVCNDANPGVSDPDAGITPDNNPNNDPGLNDGNRFGLYLGGGIHVFLNKWIALDLTVRDYIFSDNPSGLDFNGDLAVTDDDPRFLNHLFMGIGVSFFLPTTAKRTK